jgi:hypothetical protein
MNVLIERFRCCLSPLNFGKGAQCFCSEHRRGEAICSSDLLASNELEEYY